MQMQPKKMLRNAIGAAVVSACFGFGVTGAQASHIPGFTFNAQDFTINPSAVGETGAACTPTCTAKFIDFSYQGEVDQTSTGPGSATFTETGAGFYGSFRTTLGGAPVIGTGLSNDYSLYLLFTAAGFIEPDGTTIDGTFTSFSFQIWVDKNLNTTFTTTAPGAPNETKGVAAGGADDVLVLTGTLLPGEGGFHVTSGLLGGDFDVLLNVTTVGGFFGGPAFAPDGKALADLNGVNTLIAGANPGAPFANATDIIIDGSGNNSFQKSVPEPDSLALSGLGAILLGLLRLRRRKSVK